MGVLYDYFRASDAASVAQACASTGCASPLIEGRFPGLALKGIDDAVMLGQLVALIRGVEWDPELLTTTAVCPPAATRPTDPAGWMALDEDSQWHTGPWVSEMGADIRDTLGAVTAQDVPALGEAWSRIEEFGDSLDGEECAQLVGEIVAFARDAVTHDELIYVWCCL